MSEPKSRAEVADLLLEVQWNRDLRASSPDEFEAKVDEAWKMVKRKDKNRREGQAINAGVEVMGTHLPERRQAIRQLRVQSGERVTYVREPRNAHDPNAVKVMVSRGKLLGIFGSGLAFVGYVPRDMAARMAPRMDRGLPFEGQVELADYSEYDDEVAIYIRVKQLSR